MMIEETKPRTNGASVLIADDDPVTRRLLRRHLEGAGYQIIEAVDGIEARDQLSEDISVALLDLEMPGMSGLDCLHFARDKFPEIEVMVVSGQGEIRDAVAAMKQGAFDYLTKPFNPDELLALVKKAVRNARLERENRGLKEAVSSPQVRIAMVAHSPASQRLMQQVDRIAKFDSNVLITGPHGTGKTTLARMIHQGGSRAREPFVAVSCANLPRDLIEDELFGHEKGAYTGADSGRAGKAEVADGGTLFLDEIGDLPLELQPKLLTFLQDHCLQRLGGDRKSVV